MSNEENCDYYFSEVCMITKKECDNCDELKRSGSLVNIAEEKGIKNEEILVEISRIEMLIESLIGQRRVRDSL